MKTLYRGTAKIGKGPFTVIADLFVTVDPPSLSANTGVTSADLPIPGTRLGDLLLIGAPYDLQSLTVTGYVKSPGIVVLRLQNGTGGPVDLPSGTWHLKVIR